MKYIILILSLNILALQAFESLINVQSIGGEEESFTEIQFKELPKKEISSPIKPVYRKPPVIRDLTPKAVTPKKAPTKVTSQKIVAPKAATTTAVAKKKTPKQIVTQEPVQEITMELAPDKNTKEISKVFYVENTAKLDSFTSPMQLKNMLNESNLIIIDADKEDLYTAGHVDTAIHVDVNDFIKREQNPYKLMKSDEKVTDKISELGINKNSRVVIYSHNTKYGNESSTYLAFILITYGFENVSILDGGYMSWVFENERLVSAIVSEVDVEGNFVPVKNTNIIVEKKYVLANISKVTMLDARPSSYYFGTAKSTNIKDFGHIKGAKSSYSGDKFLLDGVLREKNELNDIYFKGLGLKKDDEVIVYADDVFEASVEWYMLYRVMDFKNAKIYEPSLLEYFDTIDTPKTRFKWE